MLYLSRHKSLKRHDFACILGLVIWGSSITCGSKIVSKLNEWEYLTLSMASETLYLLYVSKSCDNRKLHMQIFLAEFNWYQKSSD